MMKRAFTNNNVQQDARMQSKYQNLLQDYLELQKEYVAKKKKLKSTLDKRNNLLAQVRRRHKQLLKSKSDTPLALDCHPVHLPNLESKGQIVASNRNCSVNETALTN
ncbi:hypothetical protein AgCh_022393 [Apium graveolens]